MRYVVVQVEEVVRETEKAFLFRINGDEHWVPKSVISEEYEGEVGDEDVEVDVAEWFVEQEEL